MLLNTISKKLNLKKYLVLNLIYITFVTTLFGIFIDYPFEKYDRIFFIKKKIEFSGKFKPKLSEGYLDFNRPQGLIIFREQMPMQNPMQNMERCKIKIEIYKNYIELMFISFERNNRKCFENHKKHIINSYKDFILKDKHMLLLSEYSSDGDIYKGFTPYEVINFYRYHMRQNLFFFDNFIFAEDIIEEKKERIPLISTFKNTILFFIMPIWIFIILGFIKYNIQFGSKE